MTTESMIRVYYIGAKPVKRDTVCGTRVKWRGQGDSHLFPEPQARKLLDFETVWADEKGYQALIGADALEEQKGSEGAALDAVVGAQGLNSLEPSNPNLRSRIVAAIRSLEKGNKAHFTANNFPKLDAVRLAMDLQEGESLEKAQLNEAWSEIKDEFGE